MADARLWEVRLPQQVWVAKHQFDRVATTAARLGRPFYARRIVRVEVRATDNATRTDDVEDDLDVKRPVPRVVEDEDRGNRYV